MQISSAARGAWSRAPGRRWQRELGRPCGHLAEDADAARTSPSPRRPRWSGDDRHAGAAFATMSAGRSPRPKRTISGLSLASPREKDHRAMPIAAVKGFSRRGEAPANRGFPAGSRRAGGCRAAADCPAAICTAAAVMKPETTGWLRKFARNPRRRNPMAIIRSPGQQAMATAAPRYSGVPCAATWAAAAPVIRLATATGPTASAREVPKIA